MNRRRKSASFKAFAVFAIFVIVSGFALSAAGSVDNPFEEIAFMSQWATGGEQQFAESLGQGSNAFSLPQIGSADAATAELTSLGGTATQFQLPPAGATSLSSATDARSDSEGVTDEQNSIKWPEFGQVLYDLWFICATTAVFIVVQLAFKFSVKQIKSHLPHTAATT